MSNPEALILRRCFPVPVTFADLRTTYNSIQERSHPELRPSYPSHKAWSAELKNQTAAQDEVYAVVDGCEVRVAIATGGFGFRMIEEANNKFKRVCIDCLLQHADREDYWSRPHEVRLRIE